jgi:hypothetical protein
MTKAKEFTDRARFQAFLLDAAKKKLEITSDAALGRAMEQDPPVISKLRSGALAFSAMYVVALSEAMEHHGIAGWSVREIKQMLGQRCVGDPE